MGFVWDGTKYSTARDVAKDCGHRIESYLMGRLYVTSATHFI